MNQTMNSCGRIISRHRTVSHRKAAGTRNNKPRFDWSKRRRRIGGWAA